MSTLDYRCCVSCGESLFVCPHRTPDDAVRDPVLVTVTPYSLVHQSRVPEYNHKGSKIQCIHS